MQDGKYQKWYHCNDHSRTYLSKENISLAKQLAAKKYLQALLKDLSCEKKALDAYLKHHSSKDNAGQLLCSPAYHDLLASNFSPLSEELFAWQNAAYESNPFYPGNLCIKASSGKMVRSKSEAMIDLALYQNKIPFRYECPLCLEGITLYPDFTIRHPKTGNYYYWEHLGLMEDPSYCKHATSKIELYSRNGIIPTIQLITTFETKEHPLSPETITNTIVTYFQ